MNLLARIFLKHCPSYYFFSLFIFLSILFFSTNKKNFELDLVEDLNGKLKKSNEKINNLEQALSVNDKKYIDTTVENEKLNVGDLLCFKNTVIYVGVVYWVE